MKIKLEGASEVQKVLTDLGVDCRKQLRIAITDTSKKVKTQASRALRKELKAPSKVLKKTIGVARSKDPDGLTAVIYMKEGYTIPLKYFKPRKIAKGISATLGPTLGKQIVAGGFIPRKDKFKQSVMQRQTKKRLPVKVVKGPSPGSVYKIAGVAKVAEDTARDELPKQVQRRLNFVMLKAQGKLKG